MFITFLLQKGSKYLDDANNLIELANQVGFIDKQIQNSVPNASNCLTSSAVQASHIKRDKNVVYTLADVYGMIIPLGVGVVLGLPILVFECLSIKVFKDNSSKRDLSFHATIRLPKPPNMTPVA